LLLCLLLCLLLLCLLLLCLLLHLLQHLALRKNICEGVVMRVHALQTFNISRRS